MCIRQKNSGIFIHYYNMYYYYYYVFLSSVVVVVVPTNRYLITLFFSPIKSALAFVAAAEAEAAVTVYTHGFPRALMTG